MLEYVINGSNIEKALFLMIVGLSSVFAVLLLFYVMIKVLIGIFPDKADN